MILNYPFLNELAPVYSRVAVAGRKCAVDLEALARTLLRQRGAHGVYGSSFVLSHAIGFALLIAQGCVFVGIHLLTFQTFAI